MNMSLDQMNSLGMLSDNDIERIFEKSRGGKSSRYRVLIIMCGCNSVPMLSTLLVWIRLDFLLSLSYLHCLPTFD